jgi:hypothetical protein
MKNEGRPKRPAWRAAAANVMDIRSFAAFTKSVGTGRGRHDEQFASFGRALGV